MHTCTPCTVVFRSRLMSLIITFMFEPGEAADELRQAEREQHCPQGRGGGLRSHRVSHGAQDPSTLVCRSGKSTPPHCSPPPLVLSEPRPGPRVLVPEDNVETTRRRESHCALALDLTHLAKAHCSRAELRTAIRHQVPMYVGVTVSVLLLAVRQNDVRRLLVLVGHQVENVADDVEASPGLIVRVRYVPRRRVGVGGAERDVGQ